MWVKFLLCKKILLLGTICSEQLNIYLVKSWTTTLAVICLFEGTAKMNDNLVIEKGREVFCNWRGKLSTLKEYYKRYKNRNRTQMEHIYHWYRDLLKGRDTPLWAITRTFRGKSSNTTQTYKNSHSNVDRAAYNTYWK